MNPDPAGRAHKYPEPEDRSVRRRRKVLQAQHYSHQGRSIADIARLLEQAPATIKAYLLFGIARRELQAAPRRGAAERRARDRLAMAVIAIDDGDVARIERMVDEEIAGTPGLDALERLPAAQREAVRAARRCRLPARAHPAGAVRRRSQLPVGL